MTDLRKLAEAATPLNLASAQKISCGEIECPTCGGEGFVDGKDFLNIDGVAVGVQVYGIGTEMVAAENYYAAANPSAILALLDEKDALTARVAELEAALKPRLSKEARALLEELCEAAEAMADTAEDRKEAAALRLLLEWHDRAAAAMEGK